MKANSSESITDIRLSVISSKHAVKIHMQNSDLAEWNRNIVQTAAKSAILS